MKEQKKRPEFEPLMALGIFLFIFGAMVTYATSVPEEFWDKMVNLSSGLVLIIIGISAIIAGWRRAKKPPDEKL